MRISIALLVVLFCSVNAQAGIVELDTSASQFDAGVNNQGWWSNVAGNTDSEDSVQTGNLGGGTLLRSFYTFDLSGVAATDTVNSASVAIRLGTTAPVAGSESIGFFDVSTDAAVLNNNDISVDIATSDAIYADLGTGTSFGTFSINTGQADTTELIFTLNADGIAAVQAGLGSGFFSVGGSLQTAGIVFGGVDTPVKLTLDVTAVPEPSSLMVLGGLGCVACLRRRRR